MEMVLGFQGHYSQLNGDESYSLVNFLAVKTNDGNIVKSKSYSQYR